MRLLLHSFFSLKHVTEPFVVGKQTSPVAVDEIRVVGMNI